MDIDQLKFPIGKYKVPQEITSSHIEEWISTIEQLPEKLKNLVGKLSDDELDYQYRSEGWRVKQVVHHLADSHMNSFMRFKLIMTEDNPTIRPYQEADWAKTADANKDEIADSMNILEGLHNRWIILLKSLKPNDLERTYFHPEYQKQFTLQWMMGLYSWHCTHHLAHIEQALKLKGDFNS
jgi:hypothetical protein